MFITIIILTALFFILCLINIFWKKEIEDMSKIVNIAILVVGVADLVMIGIYKMF